MSILVLLNRSYLEIPTLDVENLDGVGNFIQRATKSYFMKTFQFQCLLGQNMPYKKLLQEA